MSRYFERGGILALTVFASASMAPAAGIERIAPSTRLLFETGRYVDFALNYVDPSLDGEGGGVAGFPIPGSTGDLFGDFASWGVGYRDDLAERLSFALSVDQPYGVRTRFPQGFYDATTANIDAVALTGILAYDATPNVKVYGGLRVQRMVADGAVPIAGSYAVETNSDLGLGYVLGVAYHKPEIALRVALSYYSAIDHAFDATEISSAFGPTASTLEVTTPQQVALEFQTGITERMLVFGSVRWVDWPQFVIDPTFYPPDQPMTEYEASWTSYTFGIGRQLTERLSGALQASYEPSTGTVLTTLGPVDGSTLVSAQLSYDLGSITVAGGATYGWLGAAENGLGTRFDDGTVRAVGIRVGYRF